jgi:hypothetical protein
MSVTWQNIKDLFYETVGDTEAAQAFFSEADVVAWANNALREASDKTDYSDLYESRDTDLDTLVGYPTYTMASINARRIWRVEYDGEALERTTAEKIRSCDRFWESRAGTPRFYLLDEYQTDADSISIRLYESASTDGVTIGVYAYGASDSINDAAPTQRINLPEWFAYSLLLGMLSVAYEADTEMQSYEKAQLYGRMWDDALHRLRIRSFGRLNKRWVVGKRRKNPSLNIRNRLPETIPEPA